MPLVQLDDPSILEGTIAGGPPSIGAILASRLRVGEIDANSRRKDQNHIISSKQMYGAKFAAIDD